MSYSYDKTCNKKEKNDKNTKHTCMTAIVTSVGNDRTFLWKDLASYLQSYGYLLMSLFG